MKKIIAIALVAMMTLTANAQVFVGGAIGYASVKANKDAKSVNTFNFAPEIGYNFNEDWTAGVTLGYQSVSTNDVTSTGIGAGIYGRYHYLQTGIAKLFVEACVDFTSYNHEGGSNFGIGLRPGVTVAISDKLSMTASTGVLGYSKDSDKRGGASTFAIGVDNTDLKIGLYYNF